MRKDQAARFLTTKNMRHRCAGMLCPTIGRLCRAENKHPSLIAAFLIFLNISTAQAGADLSHFVLTFSETFDSLSVSNAAKNDGARWYTRTVACCMADTTGKAAYLYTGQHGITSPFSVLKEGGLNIRVSRQNNTWVGGLLASVDPSGNGFSQQYGYFEMKAKFPADSLGSWPAFWMLPKPGSVAGEIDIVEAYGVDMTSMHMTLHDWARGTVPAQHVAHVGDLTKDYHTYGLLWTEQRMIFYFDDKEVFATDTPDVMKQPYYVIVDLGLGGGWPTNGAPDPFNMQVQHVKAYKQINSLTDPAAAPSK
jgi:hypothetical protein